MYLWFFMFLSFKLLDCYVACYMLMCCFHYFSLAPPRRRFIIVLHSSMFFKFSEQSECVAVWRVKHQRSGDWVNGSRQNIDETLMRKCDESKGEKFAGMFLGIFRRVFGIKNWINRVSAINHRQDYSNLNAVIHCEKKSANININPQNMNDQKKAFSILAPHFDLLLLLCQFWHHFKAARKNANLKTERGKMLISCFDGFCWCEMPGRSFLVYTIALAAARCECLCCEFLRSRLTSDVNKFNIIKTLCHRECNVRRQEQKTKIEFEQGARRSQRTCLRNKKKKSLSTDTFLRLVVCMAWRSEAYFRGSLFVYKLQLFSSARSGRTKIDILGLNSVIKIWFYFQFFMPELASRTHHGIA